MSLYLLEKSIEETRREMITAAASCPLHHPHVIDLSTALDQLLNEYANYKDKERSSHYKHLVKQEA